MISAIATCALLAASGFAAAVLVIWVFGVCYALVESQYDNLRQFAWDLLGAVTLFMIAMSPLFLGAFH